MTEDPDAVEFDEIIALALAESAPQADHLPAPAVKRRLLASLDLPPVPAGFVFRFEEDAEWLPHPVPGIRMRVLALNRQAGYATLLLDVAPNTRFPEHYHAGAEECLVISGTVYSYGRRMTAGDFLHADGQTGHDELWTDEGARVLLVVPPEDYMLDPDRPTRT